MVVVKRLLSTVAGDSHYRNSLFLIFSNAATAGLGFAFWLLATRLYGPAEVGIAGALISAVTLLTTLSVLGLNVSIIRFLPRSKAPNSVISMALVSTSVAAAVLGIGFVAGIGWFSPELVFLRQHWVEAVLFVVFTVLANGVEIMRNSFIGYRSSKYVLLTNTFFSVAKLILPFLLVAGAAFGLFASWMVALGVTAAMCLGALIWKFGFRLEFKLPADEMRQMVKFSFGNYISGFLELAPLSLLPILSTGFIGPVQTAALYLDFTIVGVLFTLAIAISSSFLAEGSAGAEEIREHLAKTVRILAVTLVPAVLVMGLASKYVLLIFGKAYASGGAGLLSILALSSLFFAVNVVLAIVLRLHHRMGRVVSINALGAAVIVGAAFTPAFHSLAGFGCAWLMGQVTMSLAYWLASRRFLSL